MNIKQTMAQRLAQAATDTTAQHLTDSSKQAAEKLASDGKMLRAQLGEILGVSESEIPSWYLDSNPHLIMRMQDSNTLAANPVVKHEMRHHFEQAVAIRQAQDAKDMANEYRAFALVDHNGHRSAIAVAHKQGSGGRGALPSVITYRQSPRTQHLNLPITSFTGPIVSDWVDGIGAPKDLTLTEDTADVVFPENTVRANTALMSEDEFCESLGLCYWNRPDCYVLAAMFNRKQLKGVVGIRFDDLRTSKTSLFDCEVETGDEIKFCTTLVRDDYDARKAAALLMVGKGPKFFKWTSSLTSIFK